MAGIQHAYQSTTPDNPADEISSSEWNAAHEVRGIFNQLAGEVQPSLHGRSVILWFPNNAAVAPLNLGASWINSGTISHPAPAAGSVINRMRRTLFTSAATIGAQAGPLCEQRPHCREAGFFAWSRYSITTYLSDMNFFVGMTSSLNPLAADPSGAGVVPNLTGIVKDSADTQLYITSRNGTGTSTRVATGYTPVAGDVLDFYMYCAPGGSTIYMRLVNLTTNTVIVDNVAVTATIPDATTMLGFRNQVRTSQAVAVAVALGGMYIEQAA